MRKHQDQERLQLAPFLDPVLPAALQGQETGDSDGWELVDRLSALECILAPFGSLVEVPSHHLAGWREAWATVLRWWREAETEVEVDHALTWLLFVAQALLRRPRRGGRKGRVAVSASWTPS